MICIFEEIVSKTSKESQSTRSPSKMPAIFTIDLGTSLFDAGDGVNILTKDRLEWWIDPSRPNLPPELANGHWEYWQVPIDVDSDSPDDPDEERNLEDYTLAGADENGHYQEYFDRDEGIEMLSR